jgi:hypothetical protein
MKIVVGKEGKLTFYCTFYSAVGYSTISKAYEKNTHTFLTTNMKGQRAI